MKKNLPAVFEPYKNDEYTKSPRAAFIATAITGAAAGTTLMTAITAGMWGWVAVYAIASLAISAVVNWALGATVDAKLRQAPKTDSGGLLVNARGAVNPQDFVYGKIRKGGTEVFLKTSGNNNKILHKIIVLAGHECNAITDIYLNDEIVTLSSDTVTSEPWDSKIKIYKHLGAQTAASDAYNGSSATLANTLHSEAGVESSFIGQGLCYLYVRLEYDQNVFANGIPTVTAVVEGKKVYNSASNATAYSANAALVIRDFLTASYGLSDDQTDDASFEAAASICDDTVSTLGGSQPKYEINGVVRANEKIGDVLQDFMTACGGTLYFGGGYWRLNVANYVTPTKTLTLDDLRSGISIDTKVPMRDNFNTVRGTHIDAANDWVSADYPEYASATFVTEDTETVATNLDFPYTTSKRSGSANSKADLAAAAVSKSQ